MELDNVTGAVALIWLVVACLAMVRLVRQGQALADELARCHPEVYATLGRPRPGYFHSARRYNFSQFVAQREFDKLGDDSLAAQFEAYRKSEVRRIVFIVGAGAIIVLIGLAARYLF